MKQLNKKGLGLLLFAGFGLVIATVILLILVEPLSFQQTIGVKQYDILTTNEDLEAATLYLEDSLLYSSQRAQDSLFASAGIPSSSYGLGTNFQSPCGNHLYPLYTSKTTNCLPNFRSAYKLYVEQNMKQYLDSYQPLSLTPYLFVNVISTPQRTTQLRAQSSSQEISLSTKNIKEDSDEQTTYPRGVLGGYGAEQTITCSTGTCFAQVAQYYYELYEKAGLRFPYVFGGESPYSYEDTLTDKKNNPQSIFSTVSVTRSQEGTSLDTVAGFDATGWLWWVGYHAGIPDLSLRSNMTYLYAKLYSSQQILCEQTSQEQTCTREFIASNLELGDLIFTQEENKVTHVMIYVGDGKVSHSQPGLGLIISDIPELYLSQETNTLQSVLRLNYLGNGQESFLAIGDGTCMVPVDFSQINTDSFRTTGILTNTESLLSQYQQDLVRSGQKEVIQQVSNPTLPAAFIEAMVYKESGTNKYAYLTGTQTQTPGNPFYGPLQVGSAACTQVNKQGVLCDLDLIKKGGFDGAKMGIEVGTAYLDWLTQTSKYLNKDQLNYYFLAIAYNAGPGSLDSILETASDRTGIPETQLQWRDIMYQDVAVGMSRLGASWARQPAKWQEVYEYPNYVAYIMSQQCQGDYFASYRTSASTMTFAPELDEEINLDIQTLSLVEDFVEDVRTCQDNLEVCVQEKVSIFNQQNNQYVTISQQGESENLAYEIADQLLNCYYNDQTNCLCTLDIQAKESLEQEGPLAQGEQRPTFNFPYLPQNSNEAEGLASSYPDMRIAFDKNGDMRIESQSYGEYISQETITRLPFTPNSRNGIAQEEPLYFKPDFINQQHQLYDEGLSWREGQGFDFLALRKTSSTLTGPLPDNSQITSDSNSLSLYNPDYLGAIFPFILQGHSTRYKDVSYIVTHYTVTGSVESASRTLKERKLSYHYIIDKDGLVYQYVPEDKSAWHAGCTGSGCALPGMNSQSIGISFVNCGYASACPDKLEPTDAYYTPCTNINGQCWERYTQEQLDSYVNLVADIIRRHPNLLVDGEITAENILGHKDVNLDKPDPGPLFEQQLPQLVNQINQIYQSGEDYSVSSRPQVQVEWTTYTEETDALIECRDNKRYFRFQAQFPFMQDIPFSIYLFDNTSANIDATQPNLRVCGEQEVIALSWFVDKNTEPLYAFDLQITTGNEEFRGIQLLVASAQETSQTDPRSLTSLNTFFKRETTSGTYYYYLINSFDGEQLQLNTEYVLGVASVDQHLNVEEPELVRITTPSSNQFLDSLEQVNALTGAGLFSSLIGEVIDVRPYLGECTDSETTFWTISNQTTQNPLENILTGGIFP